MIERSRTGLRSEYLQFEVLVRLLSDRSVFHRLPPDRLVIPLSFFYFVYGSLNEGRRVEVGSSGGPDDGRGKGRDANWIRVQWNGFGEVDLQCSAVTDSLDTRVGERANVLIEFWGPMTQYACDVPRRVRRQDARCKSSLLFDQVCNCACNCTTILQLADGHGGDEGKDQGSGTRAGRRQQGGEGKYARRQARRSSEQI